MGLRSETGVPRWVSAIGTGVPRWVSAIGTGVPRWISAIGVRNRRLEFRDGSPIGDWSSAMGLRDRNWSSAMGLRDRNWSSAMGLRDRNWNGREWTANGFVPEPRTTKLEDGTDGSGGVNRWMDISRKCPLQR
ncbi:hypothetical protein ZOSMA_71G00080 [Zostera marina]|uniref:Uncharacterized protein n=1 Tax=Zostera marina TaxID=29655 RepID=A0A0K9NSG8_ZOSMR|nr:hypothetical protein ZOSMA_71G00080 [Zostera marina]